MKRLLSKKMLIVILVGVTFCCTSCATILGGRVSDCQRTKPVQGSPTRALRAGALVADILLFWPGAIVDFATGAIYKPCAKK